jgi:hypothetical protein
MPSVLPRYTLRIPQELLDKIRYIAEENARSANREIEMMIRRRIKRYEDEKGVIELPES